MINRSTSFIVAAGIAAFSVANVYAVQLVQNGGFESGATYEATSWVKPDLGFSPTDGEPNNYARVGNWADQVGTDPNGYSFGPHGPGNGTGTQIPTRTAWLGGLNPRTSIIQQSINTAGYGSASLAFKLVYEDEDVVNHDFLYVDFGSTRVMTVDLGAGYVNYVNQFGVTIQGGIHYWVLNNPVIDLSPYMDGTTKNLTFTVINDATPSSSSSAWIDNVSINAVVPEPTTMAAAGMMMLGMRRRRG